MHKKQPSDVIVLVRYRWRRSNIACAAYIQRVEHIVERKLIMHT